jgi:endonuclease/exonuclease/phosphatase family metal-dependent hydrolase
MKISTLNIDWASKYKSKTHINSIIETLSETASDIIIVTESLQYLKLPGFEYVYQTTVPPKNIFHEGINYTKFLKNEPAVRVAIYSKYEAKSSYEVSDAYTSICKTFETAKGPLTVYATIIGTQFTKRPYAANELKNCITDCIRIYKLTDTLFLAGDLNTSFIDSEINYEMKGIKSRKSLLELCEKCGFDLTTGEIVQNIDHILLPKQMVSQYKVHSDTFIDKDILSDHLGVFVEIN